jgi:uncharacterized protein
MIIDSHTHVDKFRWYDPPETILRLMDEARIDQSIIMTYSDAPDVEGSLEYIAEAVHKYPSRFVGYARLNPVRTEEAARLLDAAIAHMGFKGLKLHPVTTLCHPAAPETLQLIHLAASYGAPTLFHCGDEELTLPLQLAEAAAACPEATIIFGHCGGYFHVKDALRVAERYPNVILETSAMPYPHLIREAVDRIGSARVLYASDGPGCDPTIELLKIRMARLSPREEADVLHGNISNILAGVQETRRPG